METKSQRKYAMTPLLLLGAFISLTELIAGLAVHSTSGSMQEWLTAFICIFPILILVTLGLFLWFKPYVLYTPAEYGNAEDVSAFVRAMKEEAPSEAAAPQAPVTPAPPVESPSSTDQKLVVLESSKTTAIIPVAPTTDYRTLNPETAMIEAFVSDDGEKGEEYFAELIKQTSDPIKRAEHALFKHYLRFTFLGDVSALAELQSPVSHIELKAVAARYCGLAFRHMKEFAKAKECFKVAFDSSPENGRVGYVANIAECTAADGNTSEAIEILLTALTTYLLPKQQSTLYESLAGIYESGGQWELRALALEKTLENKPEDLDLKFATGWAYMQHSLRGLAALHFENVIDIRDGHAASANNLGVLYDGMKMPSTSISYYRKAFGKKNSLAGANMAYRLLQAGFVKQADEILSEAAGFDDVHQNVNSAKVALKDNAESEAKTKRALLEGARVQQKYMRKYAEALFVRPPSAKIPAFSGIWISTANDYRMSIVEAPRGQIAAEWTHENNKYSLTGLVSHRSAKIDLKKSSPGISILSLLGSSTQRSGYAYVSADGDSLEFLVIHEDKPEYWSFRSGLLTV